MFKHEEKDRYSSKPEYELLEYELESESLPDLLTEQRRKTPIWRAWLGVPALMYLLYLVATCHHFPYLPYSKNAWTASAEIEYTEFQLSELGAKFTADQSVVESLFLSMPSPESLNHSLGQYTKIPHLAGSKALARYTKEKWQAAGLTDVKIVEYEVLLNNPTNRSSVSLTSSKGDNAKPVWQAKLVEDRLGHDNTSDQDRVPVFHGYSANGSVSGQLVYLNYASPSDFEALYESHVNLTGRIGIARYGHLFRGIKVELAQLYGMSGLLLYDDPSEDGNFTVQNGFKAYPDGPARNPSSVQRGSVQFLSKLPGDPSTPGYASTPGCERKDPSFSIPVIPSLPISGDDAKYLLATLNKLGPEIKGFKGSLPGVDYSVGPNNNFELVLTNIVEYDYVPIYNVIGRIEGHFEDTVILGNHRDAWVRGASDPSSGSAALDSVVSTFGQLCRGEGGYTPLRTLVFASWDAEEYGLVGSTEWVEDHAEELGRHAVAYLNVDVASSGSHFSASASPFFNSVLRNTSRMIPDPAAKASLPVPGLPTAPNSTLYDSWPAPHKINTLGSGSDYTAFQDHLGITSLDMGFRAGQGDAVYHYHSEYDDLVWLNRFGDVGLRRLRALTQLWGIMAWKVVESPLIPFSAGEYADELVGYVEVLQRDFKHSFSSTTGSSSGDRMIDANKKVKKHKKHHKEKHDLNAALGKLLATTSRLSKYAHDLDVRATYLTSQIPTWSSLPPSARQALVKNVKAVNQEYRLFERGLLDDRGLKGREWFKSIVFAPGRWTGYAGVVFPGIREAFHNTVPSSRMTEAEAKREVSIDESRDEKKDRKKERKNRKKERKHKGDGGGEGGEGGEHRERELVRIVERVDKIIRKIARHHDPK